jgi:hypothetical protein
MNAASGQEAVFNLIAGFHERRPGAEIDLASGIDHHHGKLSIAYLRDLDGNKICALHRMG